MSTQRRSLPSRAGQAILLAATGIYALFGVIWQLEEFSRFGELPTGSRVALVVAAFVNAGAAAAYAWATVWVLRGFSLSTAFDVRGVSPAGRLSFNSLVAVFLCLGALSAIFGLYDYVNFVWLAGGVPQLLISLGWGSTTTFFVYDTMRFCLFSFVAIWPVTCLRPQKPVLYSAAMLIVLIVLLQYWRQLDDWTTLPHQVLWAPWLVLIHVLSIPAMYLVHLRLNRTLESPNAYSGEAG